MPPPPSELVLAVFGEDRAHWDLVRFLTDARIEARVSWVRDLPELEDEHGTISVLTSIRRWLPYTRERPWFDYKHRKTDRRLHGKHGPAALVVRRALLALLDCVEAGTHPAPDVVFIAMDVDRCRERVEGMREELRERPPRRPVILALPDPESEAWMVALFEPRDGAAGKVLEELRRELSFDPSAEPHRLSSTARDSPRDAKRVRARLLGGDWRAALSPVDFGRAERVGGACGLADLVREIDATIVHRLDPATRDSSTDG